MTKHVLEKLEREISHIQNALLNDIPAEIARAAAQGDLSENAEYEQALSKRDMFQSKLVSLEKRIAELASLDVDRLPRNKAAYGSRIQVLDLDTHKEITYRLVLPEELDDNPTNLSISSPIGTALVGVEEGSELKIKVPSGIKRFEVLSVATIHDQN